MVYVCFLLFFAFVLVVCVFGLCCFVECMYCVVCFVLFCFVLFCFVLFCFVYVLCCGGCLLCCILRIVLDVCYVWA